MSFRRFVPVLICTIIAACQTDVPAPRFDPAVPPSSKTVTVASSGEHQAEERAENAKAPEDSALVHYVDGPPLGVTEVGTRVDVVGVFPLPSRPELVHAVGEAPTQPPAHPAVDRPASIALNLLQNVAVADVHEVDGVRRVGLSLSSDEAASLMVASRRGTLHYLPRGNGDSDLVTMKKTTLREALEDLEVQAERRSRRRSARHRAAVGIARDERGLVLSHGLPAGVLAKGSRVDIYGTFPLPDSPGGPPNLTSISLAHDVVVVAADDEHAAISVSMEEAEMLLLAEAHADLDFVVRRGPPADPIVLKKTLRDVLENLEVIQEKRQIRIKKVRRPKKKEEPRGIEIIRGDSSSRSLAIGSASSGSVSVRSSAPTYQQPASPRFEHHGFNRWTESASDNLSTFAADVDTGSYTVARSDLRTGQIPVPESVRVEEWINFFDYGYREPTDGPFGVSIEAAPSPFQSDPNHRLMRIGVQTEAVPATGRKPVHLTFLVDVSGSMNGPDRLGLAQKALKFMVRALDGQDTVAIVTYAGRSETLLVPTSVSRSGDIFAAIEALQSGGGTAMNDGLATAYELAGDAFVAGHENRVMVLSDGDANIGPSGTDEMLRTISAGAKSGITLTTLGFGSGNYRDEAMERLADAGNGNYFYIDGLAEAQRVLGDQIDSTLRTVARDVKLQVEFDPKTVKRYRLVGYENRDIADDDFRNDAVDAGELGAGHSVTALYEVELTAPTADLVATVRIRHRPPTGDGPTLETTAQFWGSEIAPSVDRTSYAFRFALAVAAFAEVVRESPFAAHISYAWIRKLATDSSVGRPQWAELGELIARVEELRGTP